MRRFINVALSLGVLAYAFYFLDWEGLAEALNRIRFSAFIEAVTLTIISVLVMAARWHRIIARHVPLSARSHMRIYLYATFLNSFTPANVGGDVYRVVSLRSRGADIVVAALALVRERVVGLVGYLLAYVGCFLMLLAGNSRIAAIGDGVFAWSAGIAGLTVLIIVLTPIVLRVAASWSPVARYPRLVLTLKKLALAVTSQSLADLSVLLGLSFVSLALWIAAIGSIADDVGLELPWLMLAAIAVLVEIVRLVPISVQGIGVREGAFALLASFAGASAEIGFIVAAVSYLALSAALLCSGLISWGLMWGAQPTHEKPESDPNEPG